MPPSLWWMSGHESAPERVVEQQVEAYNQGDIDTFVECYSEQATVADLGQNETLGRGRTAIREHFGELFDTFPDLHCEVREQFRVGDYVVLNEYVTGTGEPRDALAVYRVKDGLIRGLWLGES